MSYVLDSSSIFEVIAQNAVPRLIGCHTVELASYELGNILRKRHVRHERPLGKRDLEQLVRIVKETLSIMEVTSISCSEESILDLATALDVTFYDASYVHLACQQRVPLVTEDSDLSRRAKQVAEVLRTEDLLAESGIPAQSQQ